MKSHIEDQVRYVEDVAVIQASDDDRTATRELVRSKDDELVYLSSAYKLVPALSFTVSVLSCVALVYFGALDYLIDEEIGKTCWLVGAYLGWGLGVISRLFVKDEPQSG
ncbi:hypothetical protein NDS46_12955 [Paenibacillus thiaminolyticus]|uniref:hypothetical protein n=1 Tax=Paenibacillus thiaminolyticus TaxID=49283 RepID=UPI00232D80FB|nr:hypothetical protein [Paenibacillus thiaminolyticus]WCF10694.1 hypothetical protein NDS46_12955 [Paenibacillus thiaminolyticus]